MWSSFYDPFTPHDPFFNDPFFAEPAIAWRLLDRSGGGGGGSSGANRRRAEQGRIQQQQQQQQQQQGAPRAAGGGRQLTTTGGGDVGIFDFNRLLNEPLNLGLEEYEQEYQLHVRQPQGLKKKDLHVEINNGVLTIFGEREREKTGGEVSYVSFQRLASVPSNVNIDGISAQYSNDGALIIHLPKIPGTGRKRIDIVGASDQSIEHKESSETFTGKGGEEEDQRKDSSAARHEYVTQEVGAKTEPQQQKQQQQQQQQQQQTACQAETESASEER